MKKAPKMNKKIILFGFFLVSILSGFFLPLSLIGKNEPVEEKPKDEFVAVDESAKVKEVEEVKTEPEEEEEVEIKEGGNCTEKYGHLMLINPNFTVSTSWIDARRSGLVSISKTYGIIEGNRGNGDNLLDAEAAKHMNDMVNAYKEYNVGHTMETRSCYRARGTSCGRLCYATGTSDHHTGFTCDLLDPQYGTELNTGDFANHKEWQWLKENSYKYGFIDRFPVEWAGGSMTEPVNVDANGSTGLYETWHYRYVGVKVATEIATGKYNNGKYDSLEHYLKMTGKVSDLKNGKC
jgi:D-alanyl-D-alanine carboxypeptidase